jgi:hypothetical protein
MHDIDIARSIASGYAVKIRVETCSKKAHWLIWDKYTDLGVIAVRDEYTKEIVTLLCHEHNGRIVVDKAHIDLAKKLCQVPYQWRLESVDIDRIKMCSRIPTQAHIFIVVRPLDRTYTTIIETNVALKYFPSTGEPWGPILPRVFKEFPAQQSMIIEQALVRLGPEVSSAYVIDRTINRPS